jgi:HSP20 family protein
MAEAATKLPIKIDKKAAEPAAPGRAFGTFENLRREIDRVFDSFHAGWRFPFGRSLFDAESVFPREVTFAIAPAVDVVEKEKAYEITAELPGLDEKDIEVKLVNGTLTIKGEKEEKEEKDKDYYLSERRYGAFQRAFYVPEGVDAEKIEAAFNKGVLTVTLPKTAEAQKAEKKIEVKAA